MLAFSIGCMCDSDFKCRYIVSVLCFLAEDLKSFDLLNILVPTHRNIGAEFRP